MASNDSVDDSVALEDGRRPIARWRETRTRRRAPMAAAPWATGATFAQRDGLASTARPLGIDYDALKRRVTTARSHDSNFRPHVRCRIQA